MNDTKDDRRDDGEETEAESPAGGGPDRESWETRAVFRETYLSLYAEPEIRAAYRRVGIAIYEGALAREETYADRSESPVAAVAMLAEGAHSHEAQDFGDGVVGFLLDGAGGAVAEGAAEEAVPETPPGAPAKAKAKTSQR